MPSVERPSDNSNRGFKAKLGTSKIVSYEDLLIAQYIDDIKKPPGVSSKSRSGATSSNTNTTITLSFDVL